MVDGRLSFDVQPTASNHFAWMRTILGLQRTLMAAARTAVSLIGFGFTVAQFFQRLQGQVPEGMQVTNPAMPRNVGLILIAAGVISLIVFTIQYRRSVRYMNEPPFDTIAADTEKHLHRSTYLVCVAVIVIGIFAFGSVFVKF